jgi:gas vesicle protein GvpK
VNTPNVEPIDLTGRCAGDLGALNDFAQELRARGHADQPRSELGLLPRQINADGATLEKDLAKLVLALIDVIRRLMERQAARRVNAGSLSDDEVERMGETFLRLDRRMAELKTVFGLEGDDLNLNLGRLRDLL